MALQIIRLPDGQSYTVTPVFAGLFFKSRELSTHINAFPIGWSVVLHTQDDAGEAPPSADAETTPHVRSFTRPTLQNDKLFISSISNPSSNDFKPATSPTRQIAMMLWVTLYWYFHQPEPPSILHAEASKHTPESGKPRGEWRINIKRDGVLRGRNLIPKLERMGLISTLDSAVGVAMDDSEGWSRMFVSRKMFWQIPGRLFLFTLQPNASKPVHSHPGSPTSSRPGSPAIGEPARPHLSPTISHSTAADLPGAPPPMTLTSTPTYPIGPFYSSSHLPTYYPPAPPLFIMTDNIRHPVRPKPPRMGEVFYTRFIHSVGQYLSFRVASLSPKAVPHMGPIGPKPPSQSDLQTLSDTSLLQKWLANPRVSAFWGGYEQDFLTHALASKHSFPVIGMWDGVPFGYFEIYWVKEDALGRYIGSCDADDWDRGFHVFIGEDWARGRVKPWLTSLVHWSFCSDYRTMSICVEPRVDNKRFIQHLQYAGFSKDKEISFPHKQAWFGRLRRDAWDGPAF
ncbi:acyl-CoA N-acyltransferase [Coniochaeta sp. 2T2.1]|nr:acyl-CoA N-acyltransferase [Coniochaeta sp. 2T2.1]